MTSENNAAPNDPRGTFPYGSDQAAAISALLGQSVNAPTDESLFVGMVTDCSTHSYSCTVTIPMKTAKFGVPCLWLSAGINRFGGCCDYNPPMIGSTVFVYLMKGQDFGVVLGQVPAIVEDPEYPGGGAIDPAQFVTAFNEDTGQVMKDLQMGGSALSGFQSQPNDAFPGDRGFYNELGIGLGVLRTAFYAKASDMCKIEGFMLEDLIRMTSMNFDAWTGATDIYVRNDKSLLTTEICTAMAHFETLGSVGEEIENEDPDVLPFWRHRSLTGYFYDLKRQFTSIVAKDAMGNVGQLGMADQMESSDGMLMDRSVVGGGLIKSRQVGIPIRVRPSEAIEGSKAPRALPKEEDLEDFGWQFDKHGDVTPQMRDALAWLIGRQANARIHPYGEDGENPDFVLQDESEAGFGRTNEGANTEEGGHFRGVLKDIDVSEIDPTKLTKPRAVKINDAWIFILPDGTITLRDGVGTAFTMGRGHTDLSSSKDVNITAGRNINMKAGHDINVNARQSLDLTAGQGQARLFAHRSAFIHSEEAGIVLSTNGPGLKGELTKAGEEFDSGGIILKPHFESDVAVQTRSLFVQANDKILLGRNNTGIPTIFFEGRDVYHKLENSCSWRIGGREETYINMVNNHGICLETSGGIQTEGNIYAPLGTVRMLSTHDEHKQNDFCAAPGPNFTLVGDRIEPIYGGEPTAGQASIDARNAARQKCGLDPNYADAGNDNTFDWNTLHGVFDRIEVGQVLFSLRTEKDYGTDVDDFAWTEQPWMREWTGAVEWGDDAHTTAPAIEGGTVQFWCYPGTKYWTGNSGLKTYTEENVEPNGNPKKRDELEKDAGSFEDASFAAMKRHP